MVIKTIVWAGSEQKSALGECGQGAGSEVGNMLQRSFVVKHEGWAVAPEMELGGVGRDDGEHTETRVQCFLGLSETCKVCRVPGHRLR